MIIDFFVKYLKQRNRLNSQKHKKLNELKNDFDYQIITACLMLTYELVSKQFNNLKKYLKFLNILSLK